jgi:hypothetical protein
MKPFLEIVLIVGVIAWAVCKLYLEIDYGLVKAIVLLTLICYGIVLSAHFAKQGNKSK